ncbi:importin subunit beta-1-like [Stylonychia lemnae]|uniref:Importin subunit beta-1-like n=1 Tax=Stylonychia lemnae TaxID=5949 RepID=A0A078AX64_STYLE|nr:importin subunit beta-1-like [Stylonychia lemnae]|eukprot:CDW87040.1 importin subunit beta-1-like [Stylonychia lemnae]
MEFYPELKTHLANTLAIESQVRKQSENEIRNCRDTDPRKFLASLTKELADETNPDQVRLMSAVLVKNFIANKGSDQRYQDYWIKLDANFKEQLKTAFLGCLATQSLIVRKQVASAIAMIASIEIPRNEWIDLIPNLSGNAAHDSIEIREASLETLGFICEELQPCDLTPELKNFIVQALVRNLSADASLTKTTLLAAKAFFLALPYASNNFKVDGERDYIMARIFELLTLENEEIRVIAMQTLVEVGRQEYEFIKFYFQKICEVTALAAKSDLERLGAQGIEFWTSLAEEEAQRIKKNAFVNNYIQQCCQQLAHLLIECIQKVNIQDDEEDIDEFGVALSAGCCLGAISVVVGNEIMEPVLGFVSTNIQNPEWIKRYSALLALGAITEGPDKIRFMNVIIPGIQNLIQMFQDQHPKVRETIGWVMQKICESHSDVITNPTILPVIIPVFIQALQDKPRISNQVCRAIEYLSYSCGGSDPFQAQNYLTPFFKPLFDSLFQNAHRTDFDGTQCNLALSSFSALQALCENAAVNSYDQLYNTLLPVLQLIEQTMNTAVHGEIKSKEFQDYLTGLLQIILVKVGNKVDNITASNIIKLIVMIFQNQKKVTENGLIALSGLINGVADRVDINEFGSYLVFALKGTDDECVRLGCGIVSDLACAFREQIASYLQDFVPPLIQILKDSNQDRHSKLQALVALGDLAMCAGQQFSNNYLIDTLKILESASKQSLSSVSDDADPDLYTYLRQLRVQIVECYTTVVHGVHQLQHKQYLAQFVPNIMVYLQQLLEKTYSPSLVRNNLLYKYIRNYKRAFLA